MFPDEFLCKTQVLVTLKICNGNLDTPSINQVIREELRINHKKVRNQVSNCFRSENKYEVSEEVHCIYNTDSTKRVDNVITRARISMKMHVFL